MEPKEQYSLPPLGRPVYIQTYMPTSEHIRKNSVLEIKTLDDLVSNRLGVSAWENSCEFCDNFMEDCPGHNGHLELPIPVYRVFFVRRLLSILNCVCFYCQRLRMPKSDKNYKWIRSLPKKHRLQKLEQYSAIYKTCGQGISIETIKTYANQPSAQITDPCRKMFVIFQKEDKDNAFVRAVIPLDSFDHEAYTKDPVKWRPISIGPQDIYNVISNLDPETKYMLGCDEWNDPEALMWSVLPIPSLNTRPSHTFDGLGANKKRAFNDWTKYLREIVTARNDLQRIMHISSEKVTCCHYSVNGVEHRDFTQCFRYGHMDAADRERIKKRFKTELRHTNYGAIEAAWRTLNKNIAAFHSHKHRKYIQKAAYGKPMVNVEERYKFQKNGRFRGNVISRRTRLSGRGVLEGTMDQAVDQVGIPQQEAMNLSLRINVNRYNMADVQKWILNGPHTYPGANYVTMKWGKEINLAFYENRRTINVSDVLFVERHLLNDDIVIVNRQPTLHRPSMMSFRVRVIGGYCIRLHYAVFTPLAADCDGDEVNFQVIQGLEAQAEARSISSVENSIMKDGKIWIQFILNPVIGAHLLTRCNTILNMSEVQFIMNQFPDLEICPPMRYDAPGYDDSGEYDNGARWSGYQVVSMILPADFTLVSKELVIRRGIMISGQLNEKLLNGTGGILYHMYRDYKDKSVTMKFLYHAYIVFQRYLDLFGHSVGYYDCAIDMEHQDMYRSGKLVQSNPKLQSIMEKIERMSTHMQSLNDYSDSLTNHTPDSQDEETEKNVLAHITQLSSMGTELGKEYHLNIEGHEQNGLLHMIRSGAKGSDLTLNQMCMMVGQIAVIYKRFPHPSSHYRKGKNTANMYGFIGQSYSRGIPLSGVIMEAHAACEAIVKKNKGTSGAGYTIRKLTSCMMGIVVDYKNRTVDTHNRIIWTVYGNDGYDPQCLLSVRLPLEEKPNDDEHLRSLRTAVKAYLARCLDALNPSDTRVPLDMAHLLDRCEDQSLSRKTFEPAFAQLLWKKLVQEKLVVDTNLTFKLVFFDALHQKEFSISQMRWLSEEIVSLLHRACIQPGEAVGINATQNMGEPFAQLSLKTPHFSGKFTSVVAGTTRIANLIDGNFCSPQLTIVLKPSVTTQKQANVFGLLLNQCYLNDILESYPTYTFDEEDVCILKCRIDMDKCKQRIVSLRKAVRNIIKVTGLEWSDFQIPFMDQTTHTVLRICISQENMFWQAIEKSLKMDLSDKICVADSVVYNLCHSILIHGMATTENFVTEQISKGDDPRWVVTTLHQKTDSNKKTKQSILRQVLCMPQVDSQRTTSNDIMEMCNVFGTHAARKSLENEFMHVLSGKADSRHIKLVARVMASDLVIKGMKIKQVAQNIPPLQRAAYERGPEQMVEYCSIAERDFGQTICGAVLMNKTLPSGTGFNMMVKPLPNFVVPDKYRLIHNAIPTNIKSYVFSPKPDGVRYFLSLFHGSGTSYPRIAVLVDRSNTMYELDPDEFPATLFAGTVLDGELVQIGETYVFLVFDCLMAFGNKTSVLRYDHRLEIAREVVYRMVVCPEQNNTVPLEQDQKIPLDMGAHLPYCLPISLRPETSTWAQKAGRLPFLLAVKPIFDMSGLVHYYRNHCVHLPFKFDGMVFTNVNDPVYPFRMKANSILKWKPKMENTIDFVVTRNGSLDQIRPCKNKKQLEQFRSAQPATNNVWLWCVLPNRNMFCFSAGIAHHPIVENHVYECGWNTQLQTWQVLRMRSKDPNAWDTVVNTIQNIVEEISIDELGK